MNREIKFSYIFKRNSDGIFYECVFSLELFEDAVKRSNNINNMLYNDQWEILARRQFTGLKDKVGKEVYEGDVYRDEFFVSDEHGVDTRIYFVCAYVKLMSAFC